MVSNFAFHEKIIIKTDTWVGHLNTVFGRGGGGAKEKGFCANQSSKVQTLGIAGNWL